MSIESVLKTEAEKIAANLKYRDAALEAEQFDLEKKLADIKVKRDAIRGAPERLLKFQFKIGTEYQCPRCLIEHDRSSALITANGTDHEDVWQCRKCGADFAIPF
jgi:hypothetical protein